MSTTLTSVVNGSSRTLRISTPNYRWTALEVREPDDGMRNIAIDVDRAEFLAAVATELDVIVIPRADLPWVVAHEHVVIAELDVEERGAAAQANIGSCDTPNIHPEWHRAKANAHLALAEYLDAHPPVDEAQVKQVRSLLGAIHEFADSDALDLLARGLVARGVTVKEDPR